MKVTILTGANTYACIEHGSVRTDIRLSAGRSPAQSLREYAKHLHQKATIHAAQARLAELAADFLAEQEASRGKATP